MAKNETEKPVVEASKQAAQAALKKDIALLIKKVESQGKPLTSQQRALLMAYCQDEDTSSGKTATFVDDQTQLAKALGLKSRKTISRWLKELGGTAAVVEKGLVKADGRYDVVAWKAFAKTKGHKFEWDEQSESPTGNATKAKAEQLLIQNDRLRLKYGRERGELIPRAMAQQVYGKLILTAKTRCYSCVNRFVMHARMAANTTEAIDKVKAELDEIFRAISDGK